MTKSILDYGAQFGSEVIEELSRATSDFSPFNSAHEAYAVMLEELDEFWEQVRLKKAYRDSDKMRQELIQIAAMACRASIDLGLEDDRPAMVKTQPEQVAKDNTRMIYIEDIQKVVAAYFSLKVAELKSKNNSRRVAHPRQIAMFLARKMTERSLPQIGREFGAKHHTTVLHSIRKIEDKLKKDIKFEDTLKKLRNIIKNTKPTRDSGQLNIEQ